MQDVEENCQGYFHFDPDDPIYGDHFPGRPVVPGSLIVQAFHTAACKAKGAGRGWRLENFRFKQFLAPGTYAYAMKALSAERLRCRLFDQGRAVVTGTLLL